MPEKTVLHVGCGVKRDDKLPEQYRTPEWREVRLDINPNAEPDIVGDIRDLRMIEDASVDAVFSSHNLEHLYYHEAETALREFFRVVRAGGHVLIACPDLQQVARLIAEDRLMDPVFTPPAGPVAPIDMLYGYRPGLARGNHFMAHKTGFTPSSLRKLLEDTGFEDIRIVTQPEPLMDMAALAHKK
ncbi:class I SAM-dependent methyltransferase [Salidesulfovibrio onnuriiensis]|uniref:class I SAM-dependent methyltransferase n=1 Tax=Salidesulfovibrio onnuriiensis TaxID=2583823 RepID=UPI0011C7EB0B|nr:methyltransferase domain-containing protein [Salidesulfovibrio onnuriiensis]